MRSRASGSGSSRLREFLGAPLGLAVAALAIGAAFGDADGPGRQYRGSFDLQGAQALLEPLAAEPRPHGSQAHARVREWIASRIESLGLEVVRQRGTRALDPDGGEAEARRVERGERDIELVNLMVRLPGSASSGTLLLVAHYDSREETPGAADNGAAVACFLERIEYLARERRGGLRNDVVFLFTDGEELGLHGARLFVEEHPWLADVRCVLNFDAIGNDGPLVLFQTGPASAHLVKHYEEVAPHPVATSLAARVYASLPNDTDFTPFLEQGVPGLNLAIVGGGSAYHAPFDRPEHLAPQSLSRLGRTIDVLLERLGAANLAGGDDRPLTFFDLTALGMLLLVPPLSTWVQLAGLLALIVGVALELRRRGLRLSELAGGLVIFAVIALCGAMVLTLEWLLLRGLGSRFVSEAAPRGNAQSTQLVLAGLLLLTTACAGTLLHTLRGSPERDRRRGALVLAGCALWIPALGALCLLDGPAAAQLPLVALVQGLALARTEQRRPWSLALGGALIVYLLAPHLALAFHLLSTNEMKAVGMFAALVPVGGGILLPWLERHRPSVGQLILLQCAGSILVLLGGRLAALGA